MGERGVLVFKDFTTVVSEHDSTRNRLFACLREIYDGRFTRLLGTKGGRTFEWEGKAGLIGGVTEAIDTVNLGLPASGSSTTDCLISPSPTRTRHRS